MIPLDISGLILLISTIIFGPPIILSLIGLYFWVKDDYKNAKKLWIISGVYLIIGVGLCFNPF